ncbi:hypothetical protein, partial [Okeania sp.]|uniref:hypothetical protein n=1 Tax=Okeania sp. TaxID=3100323 RepID=UPI002B4B6026
ACIFGSALGTLGVAFSGQVFYAVAPITLALSLNVANRYRLEQYILSSQKSEIESVQNSVERLEKNAVKVIIKLRQQLSTEIKSVREQLSSKSIETVNSEIQQQLTALEHSASSVEKSLASVDNKAMTADDWEIVNGRLLVIEEAIANLQKDMEILPKEPQVDISELEAKVDNLEIQNTQVVKPHLKRLITLVRQLQHTNYSNSSSHQSLISRQPIREYNGE